MDEVSASEAAGDIRSGRGHSGWRALLFLVACLACAILDGFDVQLVSYVVPELARQWSAPLASFGIVFSAGLAGLVSGSLFLAPFADRYGRKIVMILALVGAAATSLANTFVWDIASLVVCRVLVGICMGIIVALVVTMAFEAAPARHRTLAVAIVGSGFAFGNMASGMLASVVIPLFGWKALFYGAAGFAVLVGLMFVISPFEEKSTSSRSEVRYLSTIKALVSPGIASLTLTVWLLHFGGVGANYLLLSWLPSLLTRAGYTTSSAAFATSLISLGGLCGGVAAGYLLSRFGLRWLLTCYVLAFLLIALLPLFFNSSALLALNIVIGVCLVGGYICNSVVTSEVYPAHLRATGLGWAQGIGRTGSIVSPLLVSLALQAKAPNEAVLLIAAVFPFLSASAVFLLMKRKGPMVVGIQS